MNFKMRAEVCRETAVEERDKAIQRMMNGDHIGADIYFAAWKRKREQAEFYDRLEAEVIRDELTGLVLTEIQ